MPKRPECWIVLMLLLTTPSWPAETSDASNEDTAETLRQQLARQAAPPTLDVTWYRPHEERKGKMNPVAVVLASKAFPVSTKDFWVRTLWQENYCTLVLTTESDKNWGAIRTTSVMKEIADIPEEVPADPNRLLLIVDTHTGRLAMRMLDTFPNRIIGVVFISFTPVQITPMGPGLWQPGRTHVGLRRHTREKRHKSAGTLAEAGPACSRFGCVHRRSPFGTRTRTCAAG